MNDSPIRRPDERAGLLLRELYRRHGYQSYRMSKFEPYDMYARNKSFLVSENILTFTDTDGRLMALKPDVTLSIIKNIQPSGQALEKVYYHENVYRTSPAAAGYREIMQTGLECTGALDLSAMGEVLALAAESLALLSEEYLLDLGHVGLVSGLLAEQEGLEDGVQTALLGELGRKNAPAIRSLCAQAGLEHGLSEKLCRLSRLYGPPAQVLPQLETLAGGREAREALEELDGLCRILERLDLLERVRLDFSIVNDMRYYNGVIFRGYLPGLASGVLAGGRYDCCAAWERPAGPSASRSTLTSWSGWTRATTTTWTCCCSTIPRTIPPPWRRGPGRWRRRDAPSAWSGLPPSGCGTGNWSAFRKEGRCDGASEYCPPQGPPGREGLRPVQGRRVSLPLH